MENARRFLSEIGCDMAWKNPIRTVQFCFSKEKQLNFSFADTKNHKAIDEIVAFAVKNDVVIIGLEGFTEEELETLMRTERSDGRTLFPSPSCCETTDCICRRDCISFHDIMPYRRSA